MCAHTLTGCVGPATKMSAVMPDSTPPGFPQTELTQNKHETDRKTNWNRPKFSLPSASYRAVHHYLLYFLHLALFCPPTAPKKSEFLVLPFADGRHRRHVHSPARRDGSSLSGEFSFLFFVFDLIWLWCCNWWTFKVHGNPCKRLENVWIVLHVDTVQDAILLRQEQINESE